MVIMGSLRRALCAAVSVPVSLIRLQRFRDRSVVNAVLRMLAVFTLRVISRWLLVLVSVVWVVRMLSQVFAVRVLVGMRRNFNGDLGAETQNIQDDLNSIAMQEADQQAELEDYIAQLRLQKAQQIMATAASLQQYASY
jgi:hypothetical protein